MKPWLLIVNDQYYPSAGTGDWCGFYETEEDAIFEGEDRIRREDGRSYTIVNVYERMNPDEREYNSDTWR